MQLLTAGPAEYSSRTERTEGWYGPKILSGYGWPSGLTLHGQVDTVRKPALA